MHRPFPLNPYFASESVLSEELRNEIYKLIMVDKRSVREISIKMGVDMRRIGAVVRLVELEKRMKGQVCIFFSFFSFVVGILFLLANCRQLGQ